MANPSTRSRARSPSRRGRFPALAIGYAVAKTESKRQWRRVRSQDLYLALSALGVLVLVVSLPIVFGLAREFGADLAAGDVGSLSLVTTGVAAAWLGMVSFGIVAGVGSEGEVDQSAAVLTVRPPKDIAGGLLVAQALGYAPFVGLPAIAIAAGLAIGVGAPAAAVGILAAALVLLVTGVVVGFATGLAIKGAIRRSALLTRLKPILGVAVVGGYFWLAFSGRLGPVLGTAGDALATSPVGWLTDLALVTTPGAGASALNAGGAVAIAAVLVPIGVLATVRAAEYAWYVDRAIEAEDDEESRADGATGRTAGQRLDAALATIGIPSATRGVATTVLTRAYRAPLQVIYVAVPLLLALPTFERMISTGLVPEYAPWAVVLYGAWVAGAVAPLNVLGNQGATLPRLLTSPAGGRQIVHGHVLAAVLVTAVPTAALAVAAGNAAGRSTTTLVAVGLAAPAIVAAGAVLAAGVGALFPRFSSISLSAERSAVLPSKTGFALFSLAIVLAVSAVGALTDELYRVVMATLVTEYFPYDADLTPEGLETASWGIVLAVVVAVPVAYVVAVRRVGNYRLD